MASYSVVEFSDGVQIVATRWLTTDGKSCHWPAYTNTQKYYQAVEKQEPYQESWQLFPVLRVMASTDSFEKGREMLKEAEFVSDLNSDDDSNVARKRRKEIPRRFLSSSSEEEGEDERPQPPKKSKLPPLPTPPTNVATSNKNERQVIASTSSQSTQDTSSQSAQDKVDVQTSGKPFNDMVLRLLIDMKHKINAILITQKEIQQKLESGSIINGHEAEAEIVTNTFFDDFPLDTDVTLSALDEKLQADKKCCSSVVKDLTKIGGGDIKTITKKLLQLMLTNGLAHKFSYVGGKGKQVFSSLKLCKVIQEVTRNHIPSATDDAIATCIKAWLRHAKDRMRTKKQNVDEVNV